MQNSNMQLFILPYAGGSIAAFKKLTDLIDESVDVVTVEYAGRGTRAKEPLAESIWDLLDDAVKYIRVRRTDNIPYALMGYSMGSVLAYEMLIQNKIPGKLKHLFIAAEVSPKDRAIELRKIQNPTEEHVLKRAKSLGGLDEVLLANKRFREIYIRPMLSDYRLFFEYRFGNYQKRVRSDTTFFYCEKDTALADIKKWSELIEGEFDFYDFGENHFFINSCYVSIADVINTHLRGYLTGEVYDI